MMPAPGSAEWEAYNEWLHYSEGSAMLPLMLNLYVGRLKEAGAPLHPRIDSEIANHLGYVDGALKGREFFVGPSLTGADIQMSFVGEMAKVFDKLGPYPNLKAWLTRMHARPAFQRSVEKGGAYRFAKWHRCRPREARRTRYAAAVGRGKLADAFLPPAVVVRVPAFAGTTRVGRRRDPGTPPSPTISCINIRPLPQALGQVRAMWYLANASFDRHI